MKNQSKGIDSVADNDATDLTDFVLTTYNAQPIYSFLLYTK